jgi:hypothetical protein
MEFQMAARRATVWCHFNRLGFDEEYLFERAARVGADAVMRLGLLAQHVADATSARDIARSSHRTGRVQAHLSVVSGFCSPVSHTRVHDDVSASSHLQTARASLKRGAARSTSVVRRTLDAADARDLGIR